MRDAIDFRDKLIDVGIDPNILPLPGHISYQRKQSGIYGVYHYDTFIRDGKVSHGNVYLGKLVNPEQNIFKNSAYGGLFTFSPSNGCAKVPGVINIEAGRMPVKPKALLFGDIWMLDHFYQKTGLNIVMENLIPECSDTLKALVGFRVIKDDAYRYVEAWYQRSYAGVIYPKANLASQRISEFLVRLGLDSTYHSFFRSYLQTVTNNKNICEQISVPVLIDGTGLQNNIKTHMTAISNHDGKINKELKLVYVIDKKTKFPLFFRYITENIIDHTSLIATVNMLRQYSIEVELITMDAGYYSLNNLKKLIDNNIDFLIRMTKNKKEYKKLMTEFGNDLNLPKYAKAYNGRSLYIKKVPFNILGKELYAYLMIDLQKDFEEGNHIIQKYSDIDDPDRDKKIARKQETGGRFILLASKEYNENEILPLYYQRQGIEQLFDIIKTYTNVVPVRVHSDETLQGTLLIAFLATAVYSRISYALSDSKFSAKEALAELGYIVIHTNESSAIIEELTKKQKEILQDLKLEYPMDLEKGNPLQKDYYHHNQEKKKRGRPKGRIKNTEFDLHYEQKHELESLKRRGRPKGSKNKMKVALHEDNSDIYIENHGSGRPKGTKNKKKADLHEDNSSIYIEKRER
ncbi:MAG: transposase [Deltaproteobacteria bacterium]|nr:transposase [Deltaproteobacteria bacterium]